MEAPVKGGRVTSTVASPRPSPQVVPASASDLDPKDVVVADLDDKVSGGPDLEYGIFGVPW